jgi:hypothetical protein
MRAALCRDFTYGFPARSAASMIRNNRIEFIVSPRLTDLFFVGH